MDTKHRMGWICALGTPLCLILALSAPSSKASESSLSVHAISLSGNPRVVSPNRAPVSLGKTPYLLKAGDRLRTAEGERVSLFFSSRPRCHLVLEPNSSLELLGQVTGASGEYRARLHQGSIRCNESACGLTLDVGTSIARVQGKKSVFWIHAQESATTVTVRSGSLHLLIGGQSIPLRPMTRVTISRNGNHRISTLMESNVKTRQARPSPSPAVGILREGVSPVSVPSQP